MIVATVGVVAPLVLGIGAMELIGDDFKTSLFVGAALTATSVGITARVFGDLRALATTEARIVLGAAVADDVMGLVVLTVVVRLVTEGSVSVLSVLGIVAVAVGVPRRRRRSSACASHRRCSRSSSACHARPGTLVALALAFTLAFARAGRRRQAGADRRGVRRRPRLVAKRAAERIRRELAPVGHLFIPVFFLQIGIDADVIRLRRGHGARVTPAVLLVVAIIGKLVSPDRRRRHTRRQARSSGSACCPAARSG